MQRARLVLLTAAASAAFLAGSLVPGSFSSARAQDATPVANATAAADPVALLEALGTTEISGEELPSALVPAEAVVLQFQEGDEDIAGAVGGVALAWEREDGGAITFIVYATEGDAVAAANALQAEAEAAEASYSQWAYFDGVTGFCLPIAPNVSELEAVDHCITRNGNVLVVGSGLKVLDRGRDLAHAGSVHVSNVCATVPARAVGSASPTANVADPAPIALVDDLTSARFAVDRIPPVFYAYPDASVAVLDQGERAVSGAQGAVRVSWPSTAPDLAPEATIDLYVFATDGEASAAAGTLQADAESAGMVVRETTMSDPATTVVVRCVPIDPADASDEAPERCWTVTGNVMVVATGEGGFDGAKEFAVIGVEHVETVRGD